MSILKKAVAVFSACLLILLAGCSSGGTNGKNPDPADITAKLQSEIKFPEMLEVGADRISNYYALPKGTVDQFSVYICSSSASSYEIAAFKGKSTSETAAIRSAVREHVDQKAALFQSYGDPQNYSNIQNCVLETKGPYVFLAITDDGAKARSVFESFFK